MHSEGSATTRDFELPQLGQNENFKGLAAYHGAISSVNLPKGSNVVPFRQYTRTPKKKMGHNLKGTTLEPLGNE